MSSPSASGNRSSNGNNGNGARRQLYLHSAVFVNPSMGSDENSNIAGVLSLEEDRNQAFTPHWLTWTPKYLLDQSDFLDLKTSVPLSVSNEGLGASADNYAVRVPLTEIYTIKRRNGGKAQLILQLRSGVAYPPFQFYDSDLHSFFIALRKIAEISRSVADYDLFYVHCLPLGQSSPSVQPFSSGTSSTPTTPSVSRNHSNTPTKVQSSPWNLFAGVSRLTTAARDGLDWIDGVQTTGATQPIPISQSPSQTSSIDLSSSPFTGYASKLSKSATAAGDAVEHFTPLGAFELLDDDDIKRTPREASVDLKEWNSFFDEEGRVKDEAELRRRVFYGGLAEDARQVGWKFLLNYYPMQLTTAEREAFVEAKRAEYEVYKRQWQSITPEQERHFADFVDRKVCVEKDVVRTDRTLPFFEGEDNPNLVVLSNILLSYSMFNFDLGYVQGMNDLLSVILIEMEGNEYDAFWCFKGLLDRGMADAFLIKQPTKGIQKQLSLLRELLRQTDSSFFAYLESKPECLNMIFCFRWLLILFKREFEIQELRPMWEAIWSNHCSKNFQLFLALAMLRRIRSQILQEEMGFDDLLRFTNELAYNMNGQEILLDAEVLYRRFEKFGDTELIAKLQNFI